MKNIFNVFLDRFLKKEILIDGFIQDDDVDNLIEINKLKENVICFIGGDIESLSYFKSIPEIDILPFDVCWIEFYGKLEDNLTPVIIGCFLNKYNDGYMCRVFMFAYNEWLFRNVYYCDKSGYTWNPKENMSENEVILFLQPAGFVSRFLSALNCSNVTKIENKPSVVRQAMKKKGKQPLYSTWTLEIDLNKSSKKGQYLGGTHASPRVHLRRGHARQYSPGKYTWVQPCAVGNKRLGMIDKDYTVAQ